MMRPYRRAERWLVSFLEQLFGKRPVFNVMDAAIQRALDAARKSGR